MPDIPKIQGMTRRIFYVTRLLRGVEHSIVGGQTGVSVDHIIAYQNECAAKNGPGTYRFKVYDEGGPEKDEWIVKLGGSGGEETGGAMSQNGIPGAGVPGPNDPVGSGIPGGARHLGHGYVYDESLGLLTTPWKTIHDWRPGQPLPAPSSPAPASTPAANVGWGQMPTGGAPWSWGAPWGTPAAQQEDPRVKALEDQAREAREALREAERRREQDSDRQALHRLIDDTNKRFEGIVAKLAEKPGVSPEVESLKRELEAVRAGDRDKILRDEIRSAREHTDQIVRELRESNKPDPMTPMLAQLMQTQQQSASQMLQAMQAVAQLQSKSSEDSMRLLVERFGSSMVTPERMMDLIRTAKDQTGATEIMKGGLEMYRNLFGMTKEVLEMQAELQGKGAEPAWVSMGRQAIEQISSVGQAWMDKQSRQDAAAAQAQARVARIAQPMAQPVRRASAPAPGAREPVGDDIRSQIAARQDRQAAAAAAANGTNGATSTATVTPPVPASAPAAGGKKKKAKEPEPVDIKKIPPDDMRALVAEKWPKDEDFFGPFWSQVRDRVRPGVANGAKAEEVADGVMSARAYCQSWGQFPPAIQLLDGGHIDLLVDRLIPEAPDDYRIAVADAIRVKARFESTGAIGGEAEPSA